VKIAVFTSNITGEYLLDSLDVLGVYPEIYTYPHGFQKTALSRDFTKYRGLFPLNFISANKYGENDSLLPDADTLAVCVDWTKDFFIGSDRNAVLAHPSLLPLYRGYSAVTEQFLRGVAVSGASFYMASDKIDGGDIIFSDEIRIEFNEYPDDFLKKYASVCAGFIKELSVRDINSFERKPQDERESFYLARKRKREGIIDFNRDAYSLYNHIRGFSRPFFGAYFVHDNRQITVWRAATEKWQGEYGRPGELVELTPYGAEIACGSGTVVIEEAEYDGRILRRGEVHELYYAVD
jgi:hypothetical protein